MQLNAQATKVTQDYIKFSNDRVKGRNQQNGKAAHRTEYIFQMIIQWGINNYKEFCKLERKRKSNLKISPKAIQTIKKNMPSVSTESTSRDSTNFRSKVCGKEFVSVFNIYRHFSLHYSLSNKLLTITHILGKWVKQWFQVLRRMFIGCM